MRQNVIIVLLSVVATLLVVDIFLKPAPSAQGQLGGGGTAMGGGDILCATGATTGGAGSAFWLLDAKKSRIAVYSLGNNGLELRAVRDIQFDLQATYLNLSQGKLTKPSEVRKALAGMKKSEGEEEKETPAKNAKKGKKEEESE